MIWVSLLLSCLLAWLPPAPGQDVYHTISKTWFTQDMLRSDAYFGYSITYEPTSKRLIVSAPQADNIGEIYSCEIESQTCTSLLRNVTRDYPKYKQNYWYGAVVKAGKSFFVSCAPLAVQYQLYKTIAPAEHYQHGTFSSCFKYSNLTDYPTKLKSLSRKQRNEYTTVFEQSMDSFGWSIDVADENIIIGGPAMFTGRVIKYSSGQDNSPLTLTGAYFTQRNGINRRNFIQRIIDYDFGYSVVAGYFRKIGNRHPTYAVGSPYGKSGYGMQELHRTIVGKHDNSFFGSAIVNLGDLNGDGMDEIAVAAPYENSGAGAVYVYSSHDIVSDNPNIECMQKILAEPSEHIRTFGLSLTALQDHDDNGCNELAIGAPYSNKVMLLKCMATVTVKLHEVVHTIKQKDNRNDTHLLLESCLDVTYPEKPVTIQGSIKVQVQVTHDQDHAELANPADKEYIIDLNNKKETRKCKPIWIKTLQHGNFAIPIKYTITAVQLNHPREVPFDRNRVALSELSKLNSTRGIWIADCSDPNKCLPNLKYLGSSIPDSTPYTIGSSKTLAVDLSFRNDGEVAYNPCLIVVVDGATVSAPSSDCVFESNTKLKCMPKRILKTNSTWDITAISIDTTRLTNKFENIIFHMYLYNECTGSNTPESFQETMELFADPKGIVIKGMTDTGPDDMVNMTKTDMAFGKAFEQSYTISNNGEFDWMDLKATLVIQKKYFIQNSTIIMSTVGTTVPEECDYVSEEDDSASFSCNLKYLEKKSGKAKLTASMIILPELMESVIEKNENSMYSNLTINYHGTLLKESSLTSTFHLKEATVPWWVILAASLIGLIILLIIFLILRECGFFRREKKENLERVQRQVRRQTVMRKSMMDARLPPGPDSQSLIAAEAAAQATAQTTDTRLRVP